MRYPLTDDSDIIAEAQRQLEQAREFLPKQKPRKVDDFGDQFTAAEKTRLPELAAKVRAEVEDEDIPAELLEVAIDMRARQLLREEIDPAWAERIRAQEAEREETAFRKRMAWGRFPDKVATALWTGLDPGDVNKREQLRETDALRWLREGWNRGKLTLCLVGSLGTGKTMAACIVAHESGERDLLFATAKEVFTRSDRMEANRDWHDRLEDAQVLILDECGTKKERSDSDSQTLAGLLLTRFENDRRTIVIANISKQQFEERYTEAVMSRIYESGGMHPCTEVVRRGELRRQGNLKLQGVTNDGKEE
jgi:DNA replication protein DnaC